MSRFKSIARVLGLVLLGVAIGYAVAPVSVEEKIVLVESESSKVSIARHMSSNTLRVSLQKKVVVTKWIPTTSGPAVERTETVSDDSRETTGDSMKETHDETVDRIVYRDATKIVATKSDDTWRVSVSVGREASLDSADMKYSGEVSRRVLGPFDLGVRVSSDKTVSAVLGATF